MTAWKDIPRKGFILTNQTNNMTAEQKEHIQKAAILFRVLNHEVVQSILILLGDKEVYVQQIYKKLKLEAATTSQFLAKMRKCNLVTTRREGKKIWYRRNDGRMVFVLKALNELN